MVLKPNSIKKDKFIFLSKKNFHNKTGNCIQDIMISSYEIRPLVKVHNFQNWPCGKGKVPKYGNTKLGREKGNSY